MVDGSVGVPVWIGMPVWVAASIGVEALGNGAPAGGASDCRIADDGWIFLFTMNPIPAPIRASSSVSHTYLTAGDDWPSVSVG